MIETLMLLDIIPNPGVTPFNWQVGSTMADLCSIYLAFTTDYNNAPQYYATVFGLGAGCGVAVMGALTLFDYTYNKFYPEAAITGQAAENQHEL